MTTGEEHPTSFYEAVIGNDIDEAMWGASTASAEDAIRRAVKMFGVECEPALNTAYDVTVYRDPVDCERYDGEMEIAGWTDRGHVSVVFSENGVCTDVSGTPIVWDGVAVTP